MRCKLKVILVERDISQKELAEAIGVSRNTVTSMCKKQSTTTLENALKVSNYLKLTVNEIWTLDE